MLHKHCGTIPPSLVLFVLLARQQVPNLILHTSGIYGIIFRHQHEDTKPMSTSGIVAKIVQCRNVWLIAPYALWMLLMAALPPTPQSYAIRTAAVAALLVFAIWRLKSAEAMRFRLCMADVAAGALAGLLPVCHRSGQEGAHRRCHRQAGGYLFRR